MNHLDQRSLKMIENRNSATTKTVGVVPKIDDDQNGRRRSRRPKKQQVGGKKQSHENLTQN